MSSAASPRRATAVPGIARAAGLILVVTIIARIAGFVRYLVFGGTVGAGDVGTAYASANLLPNVLFEVVAGGALAGAVIPLVAGVIEHDEDGSGPRRASGVISALMGWMLLVTVPLSLVVVLSATPLAALILGGDASSPGTVALGARMLRIFAVQIPLYGVTVLLGAFCQARRRFLWPALVPLLSSLVVMASYAVYAALSPAVATVATITPATEAVLAWGTTAGVAVMAVALIVPARRAALRLTLTLSFPAGTARPALGLAGAGLGAVGAQQGATALILLLAMQAGGTGTLPVFQYAQAVYLLPYAVLVVPLITSVFPHLSELRLVGDTAGLARASVLSLRSVIAVAAAGGAVLFAAAPGIEQFFRLLDRAGATGVGSTVAALSLGLAPYAVATQATRILSAAMRARDALVVGSIGWVCAAGLILLVVLPSGTRRTAEAATAFGLCIAVGMSVAALVGLARLGDLIGSGALRRSLYRGAALSVLAYALGALAGYAACRALMRAGAQMPWTILAGGVGGLAALVVVAVVLGIADRDTLRRLRHARTGTPGPVPAGPEP